MENIFCGYVFSSVVDATVIDINDGGFAVCDTLCMNIVYCKSFHLHQIFGFSLLKLVNNTIIMRISIADESPLHSKYINLIPHILDTYDVHAHGSRNIIWNWYTKVYALTHTCWYSQLIHCKFYIFWQKTKI